jgi:hypothetical protein
VEAAQTVNIINFVSLDEVDPLLFYKPPKEKVDALWIRSMQPNLSNHLTANPRGPALLHHYRFLEKTIDFDLESIPQLTQQNLPTATAPNVLRLLGSFEEFLWLIDQNRPVHFALAAHVQGATTVRRWRNALDLVQRRLTVNGTKGVMANAPGTRHLVNVSSFVKAHRSSARSD